MEKKEKKLKKEEKEGKENNLIENEKEKMLNEKKYDSSDLNLIEERNKAFELCFKYNQTLMNEKEKRNTILKELLGKINVENSCLMPPIHFDYGKQTYLGDGFFSNYNFTCLDTCNVEIGKNCFFGPNVSIYSAYHPVDPIQRKEHPTFEFGKKIKIGDNVWIGGGSIIMENIGNNCVIGAGSVVVKEILENCVAVGNPCKVIKKI